ncbi:MAG: polymerase sigma factor RpoE [Labilithrix sp.]|nr:polymerase sigma factor RpoE [Labilithrix sp.]
MIMVFRPPRQAQGVERLTSGPSTAPSAPSFRELFDRHFAYVWRSLARLGVAERDREDQANEVFFRIHQRLADYDPARAARPWLFAFVVRVAAEYRRRDRNAVELVEAPEALVTASDELPDAKLARSEKRALVLSALEAIDFDKRAVLILHDLDDCTIPEIATALRIPEGTAYSRLRAARREFINAVRRLQLRRGKP